MERRWTNDERAGRSAPRLVTRTARDCPFSAPRRIIVRGCSGIGSAGFDCEGKQVALRHSASPHTGFTIARRTYAVALPACCPDCMIFLISVYTGCGNFGSTCVA
jgi:hypothetical protein